MAHSPDLVVQSLLAPDLERLLPEWRALYARFPGWSPFADPDFQVAWCRKFVPVGRELLVTVRRGEGGELVAILPFFFTSGPLHGRGLRHLRPFGAHHEALINEMPEITADPAHLRASLAKIVAWLAARDDWDFVEFSLHDDQPWMEPRWLVDAGLGAGVLVHKKAYPSIVLDLPADGSPPSLKRNLKESLRRSRNRVGQLDGKWVVERATPSDLTWQSALGDLVRLHGARSHLDDSAPRHPDLFAGTSQESYLTTLAATSGQARPVIYRWTYDDPERGLGCAAALLTFEYPGRVWISASGLDPEYWRLGPITLLQWQAVQDAVAAGRSQVVFSVGIDTAKLRWTENVRVRNSFVMVHSRPRSRRLFTVWWLAFHYRRTRADSVGTYVSSVNLGHPRP